jgi:phospholipase C
MVIFQENVSFDHYFGTYPHAANTGVPGEPLLHARADTPRVNGLSGGLLTSNPNRANPSIYRRVQWRKED